MTDTQNRVEETLAELTAPRDLSKPFIYIFLRKDLEAINPMYPAIQLGHVTYELGLRIGAEDPKAWMQPSTAFCVFEVPDERGLIDTMRLLAENKYASHLFREDDWDTGYTALACHPIAGERREFFQQFQLYRAPKMSAMQLIWAGIRALFGKK